MPEMATGLNTATKVLKSLERLGVFLSDYCVQSCGHFRHHSWKKKKKSLGLLELRFCLKLYLWGIGEKIERNVELDHKNISGCSTTTNYWRNANENYSKVPPHSSQYGIMKMSTNNKCWRDCGEKGNLLHRWWQCEATVEDSMEIPKKKN